MTEAVQCPVCALSVEPQKFIKEYFQAFNKLTYKMHHCAGCELDFWTPLKMAPEFYSEEAHAAYLLFHEGHQSIFPHHRTFFRSVGGRRGRILDVGCGNGSFLHKAKELGFEVWGIDFDSRSVKVGQQKFGIENVFCMSLQEFIKYAGEQNLKFDFVSFFEVLEHMPDPKFLGDDFCSLMNPGGIVAGSVPNRDRFWVQWERKATDGDFPPHHFLWFSRKTIGQLFERSGFCDIRFLPVPFTREEIAKWLWTCLFGEFSRQVKQFILKDSSKARRPSAWVARHNVSRILIPLAFLIAPFFNAKSHNIYFEARYMKNT